nr:putative reverse transcriptase domain-containing protein [Tanacetum cinerariifolium]
MNTSSDFKTESNPSEDPSEDRSASLAITPFPDDLYMQIRQAYYATNEESSDSSSSSTIPPPPAPVCPRRKARLLQPYEPEPFMQPFRYHPNVLPSSTLSHPRNYVPEEIMPPRKRARFLSPPSSFTDLSASSRLFKIGESYQTAAARYPTILTLMTLLERHEEQIDAILNHLDEDRASRSRTQIVGFQREQMRHDDEVVLLVSGFPLWRLELPEELSNVHSTFHISNLKKCLSDEFLVIPMEELQLDDKLNFVEEPVEIMDREVKQLKHSRIPIVKVRWNSNRGPEFTWEHKDQIRAKYPHLFPNTTPTSN